MRRGLVAGAAALALAAPGGAADKRVYIAPDDHTDYMWSGDEAFYADYFVRALDAYLGQMDATAGAPSALQSRWNPDGTLWLAEYERAKPGAPFARVIDRIKDGHLGVPLNTLVSVHGGSPAELVIRDMYYAGRLERRFGFRFDFAVSMENQGLSWGLGALMAGAGAKYTWRGVCACATDMPAAGDREFDAYWWVGPDGSRLLTKWNSLHAPLPSAVDANQGPGGYAEARYPREAIPFVDTSPVFQARWPYSTIGLFGQGWDDQGLIVPLGDANSFPRVAAELTTPALDVIVSNMSDFFADFAARHGAALPEQRVSFGNEWDVGAAAIAAKSARVKAATEKLRAAEAMATIVSLSNPGFMTPRIAARDQAFEAMGLYFEHDIIGGGPFVSNEQRIAFQERTAAKIESYVDTLHADARTALGGLIPTGGAANRVFAFNPLSWLRTDVAEVAAPGTEPVFAFDVTTGRGAPSELVGAGADRRLRFLAANVPSLGYKVFEIRPGVGPVATPAATYTGGVLSSGLYRLTLDRRGAVTSLVDRSRGNREIVRASAGRALNDFGSGIGTVTLERVGPVSATVRADIAGPLPRTVRATLIKGVNRIEFENRIDAGFGSTELFAFGFNLDAPLVRHEEVGAVMRARLAPEGDYSPRARNALYKWLTLNHFADISAGDGGYGVTLSNADAYFMKLGDSTFGALDVATPRIEVLAGGQEGRSALQNQGGDTRFRYRFVLRPHAGYSQLAAMKGALEHQNPLVAGPVAGAAAAPLPVASWSFLRLPTSSQLVWALKPAEEGVGQGVIVRVWNQATGPSSFAATLGAPYRVASITRTTSIETDLVSPPRPLRVERQQIATFRLRL